MLPHPEFKTSLSKTTLPYWWNAQFLNATLVSLDNRPCSESQFSSLALVGEVYNSPPPLMRKITLGSMKNQSAMALKGQYVADRHTHSQSEC